MIRIEYLNEALIREQLKQPKGGERAGLLVLKAWPGATTTFQYPKPSNKEG